MRSTLAALTILLHAPASLAGDGVLEINQTCAVKTGCFAGDVPEFPVTIDGTAGRSYRLTSDLTLPHELLEGIVVNADRIGIDLNNFTIIGPVRCSGLPLVCAPTSGASSGIYSRGNAVSVRNGAIFGMSRYGVYLDRNSEVRNLRVHSNGSVGIRVSEGSIVANSISFENRSSGIWTSANCRVIDNVVYKNGGWGIQAGPGSSVSGNSAYQGQQLGIAASNGSSITGNSAYQNGTIGTEEKHGILAGDGSVVADNAVYENGSHGISCRFGCAVRSNSARLNAGYGLQLDAESAYGDNVVSNNGAGTVDGGVNIGGNSCNGTMSCP